MPGTYLSFVSPGQVRAGDPVATVHHPAHGTTVPQVFRAIALGPDLLLSILAAEELQEGPKKWPELEGPSRRVEQSQPRWVARESRNAQA